jgi:sigma-54 dependent transcriptional regulator, acetoin dehydrogenase operon transcriptional activator AcoR
VTGTTTSDTVTHVQERSGAAEAVSTPLLYRALECEQPASGSSRHTLGSVDEVHIGRADQRSVRRVVVQGINRLELGLPDRFLSRAHTRLTRVLGKWVLEDVESKNGTFINGRRVTRIELADGDVVEAGHVFFIFRAAEPLARNAPLDLDVAELPLSTPGLRTLLPRLTENLRGLAIIVPSDVSVIVHGESGTGKELIARNVHALSSRPGHFVAVNCGALPAALVESELFGYKKGAFSGATEERPGLVRSAHRGTLFLDEIGDLPAAAQPALLRVLQEREVVPVGGTQPVPIDVRVVSATHRNLDALVADGKFRADLLARLGGFAVTLPPLRARREELGMIASDLLVRLFEGRARGVRIALEAGRALMLHDWPFNVRELEKCLGAAAVLAGSKPIEAGHLPEAVSQASALASIQVPHPVAKALDQALPVRRRPLSAKEAVHRDELLSVLREHEGNISAAARALGKARAQIQRWVKRYRLDPTSFRN